MSVEAIFITFAALIPVIFVSLAFLRSTVLSKYLDNPHERRRE
jgi:hypothetical protein